MPIVHEATAGETGRWCLWKITESTGDLRALLPEGLYDLSVPEQFAFEKRRAEWYCTRLLLERLIPGTRIVYDEWGKPHPEKEGEYISVSHSGDYIAMIHDRRPTGIDIERIHPKIEKIASKFLCDEELVHALEEPLQHKLHVYWCAKEATYKVYGKKGVSLKSNIFVEPFHYAPGNQVLCRLDHEGNQVNCRLNYEIYDNFMLAWVIQYEQ